MLWPWGNNFREEKLTTWTKLSNLHSRARYGKRSTSSVHLLTTGYKKKSGWRDESSNRFAMRNKPVNLITSFSSIFS